MKRGWCRRERGRKWELAACDWRENRVMDEIVQKVGATQFRGYYFFFDFLIMVNTVCFGLPFKVKSGAKVELRGRRLEQS